MDIFNLQVRMGTSTSAGTGSNNINININTNTPCVDAALKELDAALQYHRGPVAWGNTNINARSYKDALKLACKHRRPVKFVKW